MERRILAPQAPKPAGATGPCELSGITRVLVKLALPDEGSVPPGLPSIKRLTDLAMDAKHSNLALSLGTKDRGEIGRVRHGRVDTGEHVVDNMKMVSLSAVAASLERFGYKLAYPHYFTKESERGRKYVVVLPFVQGLSEDDDGEEQVIQIVQQSAINELMEDLWNYCHVWRNPDGTVTVNMVGRIKGQLPKHALLVEEGRLIVAPVVGMPHAPVRQAPVYGEGWTLT